MPKVGSKKYPYTLARLLRARLLRNMLPKEKAFVRSFRSEVVLDDFRGHALWRMKPRKK